MKNLTQNRLCRSTGIAVYALCQFSAAVATSGASAWSPRRPLATLPAAWANAPYKNQFSVYDLQKNLTQNRLCRFSGIAAYALCQFCAAVATSGALSWSPRKDLATLPAAWANAPLKNL